ncbi:Replication protein A subunit, partial [Stegodyphus mimosarum]
MVHAILEKASKRVNGSMLSEYIGQPVCLLGEVIQVEPSGKGFKVKASDNQLVSVQGSAPVYDIGGIVEVHGIASLNNTIQGQHIVPFEREVTENFDLSLYNEAVLLMSRHRDHYISMA